MPDVLLVYVTCPTDEIATDIARAMIEKQYAACGNILPTGKSFFRWEGKIEETAEATIIFKTTKEQWSALCEAVKNMHPYDVPCVLALEAQDGHVPFMQWVRDETV